MSADKNAPGAVAAATEGDIDSQPIPERCTNMTIMTDANEAVETLEQWSARDRAEKQAWLALHPEVSAAMPAWAKTVTIEWECTEGVVAIAYEREFGPVLLSRWASWENNVVRFTDGATTPEVVILVRDDPPLTVSQMREIASALMAAIPVVEEAGA